MMNKELFEGPVGDYCIARNTIKFLLVLKSRFYIVTQYISLNWTKGIKITGALISYDKMLSESSTYEVFKY